MPPAHFTKGLARPGAIGSRVVRRGVRGLPPGAASLDVRLVRVALVLAALDIGNERAGYLRDPGSSS